MDEEAEVREDRRMARSARCDCSRLCFAVNCALRKDVRAL